MKHLGLILLLIMIYSCSDKKAYREFEKQWAAEQAEKERLIAKMAEKEVELGFMDFKLGASVFDCLKLAKKNTEIIINEIQQSGDVSVEFTSYLQGKRVDCKVCSFQDTITSLIILSEDADIQGIQETYKEKYGDYDKSDRLWRWMFKNAGIEIAVHVTKNERVEMIPGRENLRKDNLQNYHVVTEAYFKMLSITYNDFRQIEKVRLFEKAELMKLDSLNKIKNKLRKDSIDQENKERKNKALMNI